jgi:CO dehydrogenase maturation factor
LVSDITIKGLQTVSYLKDIAEAHGVQRPHRAGLILNRANENVKDFKARARSLGIDVVGIIPEDDNVAEFDRMGLPLIELPENSPCVVAIQRILRDLELVL